tara:strand:- start:118 stop:546 length:429 start_codon:yes stop_codon:yes gene_type:complete
MKNILYILIISLIFTSCKKEEDITGTWNFSSTADAQLNTYINDSSNCVKDSYIVFYQNGEGNFYVFDDYGIGDSCYITNYSASWASINAEDEFNVAIILENWDGTEDSIYNFTSYVNDNNLTIARLFYTRDETRRVDVFFDK